MKLRFGSKSCFGRQCWWKKDDSCFACLDVWIFLCCILYNCCIFRSIHPLRSFASYCQCFGFTVTPVTPSAAALDRSFVILFTWLGSGSGRDGRCEPCWPRVKSKDSKEQKGSREPDLDSSWFILIPSSNLYEFVSDFARWAQCPSKGLGWGMLAAI